MRGRLGWRRRVKRSGAAGNCDVGGSASRVDDDQIARRGAVDRGLNRTRGGDVGRSFAANGDGDGVDRLLAVARGDGQLAALGRSGSCRDILRLLLNCAVGHACGHGDGNRRVAPCCNGRRDCADGNRGHSIASRAARHCRSASSAKPIVAGDGPLIVRRSGCRGSGIGVVRDRLVAKGRNREWVRSPRSAHPWSNLVAVNFSDCGRQSRIVAVDVVVPRPGKGRRGHHRRIEILRGSGHERQFIAELAVAVGIRRVGNRGSAGAGDRSGVVHAEDHHRGRVTGRVRRVHFPGRIGHAVVAAPMVRIHAGDLVSCPIPDRDGEVWRRELLAELRREGIELRRVVVGDAAGELGGDMRRRVDVELGDRTRLVVQRHFLAVAEVAGGSGERGHLVRLRVEADVVGHNARFTDARPNRLGNKARHDVGYGRSSQVLGRILRVVCVVTRAGVLLRSSHRGLVGDDEDVAQPAKLLGYRGDEVVADEDVLVLFLDQFVALRQNHFHHILAHRQHGNTGIQIRRRYGIRGADGAICRARFAVGVICRHAGELVHAVVRRRLELVPVVHAVVALELGVVRQRRICGAAVLGVVEVEVVWLVIQREEEQVGDDAAACQSIACRRALSGAVHVGRDAIGPEALRVIVPTAGLRGVHLCQGRRDAVGGKTFLVKVDGDVGNQRLPLCLNQHLRVVERPGRCIDDMALDAAVLAGDVGLLAEFEEVVLTWEALPAFHSARPWVIDASGGELGRAACYRRCSCRRGANTGRVAGEGAILNRLARAIRSGAVDRARHAETGRYRDDFGRVGQHVPDRGGAARRITGGTAGRRTIRGAAHVVHHVRAGVLVAGHVGFHRVPTEEREGLVEVRCTGEVRDQQVFQAAVAQPDGNVGEGDPC